MEDARLSNQRLGIVRQKIALARHHGGGDGPGIPADDRIDAPGQSVAGAIDRHAGREPETGRLRGERLIHASQHVADRADPGEPGITREIIAAWLRGAGRRQQARLHLDIGSGLEIRACAASSGGYDKVSFPHRAHRSRARAG